MSAHSISNGDNKYHLGIPLRHYNLNPEHPGCKYYSMANVDFVKELIKIQERRAAEKVQNMQRQSQI
jgi:hypothetical protein